MKTFENYTIIKETEKALLIKAFISELEKEVEFWLPKSKTEKKDEGLEIDSETWETKIEELKTPQEEECEYLLLQHGNSRFV